jgi:hypothetical protein
MSIFSGREALELSAWLPFGDRRPRLSALDRSAIL